VTDILDGVGSIRFEGLLSRAATGESHGERWRLSRRGIVGRRSAAFDEIGATVGRFEPRGIRRGGQIAWGGRELTLRPASATHSPTARPSLPSSTAMGGVAGRSP
jgi:hypothetical protein